MQDTEGKIKAEEKAKDGTVKFLSVRFLFPCITEDNVKFLAYLDIFTKIKSMLLLLCIPLKIISLRHNYIQT